jgi:hypothetical protein
MQKVAGERYVYKFVCDPEALFSMAFPDNHRPVLKADSHPAPPPPPDHYYGPCDPITRDQSLTLPNSNPMHNALQGDPLRHGNSPMGCHGNSPLCQTSASPPLPPGQMCGSMPMESSIQPPPYPIHSSPPQAHLHPPQPTHSTHMDQLQPGHNTMAPYMYGMPRMYGGAPYMEPGCVY